MEEKNRNHNILIIDDDPGICEFMVDIITSSGHSAVYALTLKTGLEKAGTGSWDIIFLDVRLPDGNGLDAVSKLRNMPFSPEVIILTGQGTADGAAQAIRSGAWDYIAKPLTADAITLPLKHVLEIREARSAGSGHERFQREKIAGDSPELSNCLAAAAEASRNDANVLITGESGTGKELIARAIHDNSRRAKAPFVIVDCAAMPESLVESVLFGHEKGAFTGAVSAREGLIRQANGGTLFLDEVGELSLSHQKRFLRVLQERRLRPVGASREEATDFRLIAATHRDISDMAHRGAFREDLLFRLRGLTIALPNLKSRRGDTQIIAMRAIGKYCERFGVEVKGFYPEFLEALAQYPWPGNVRELIAAVEAAVIHAKDEPLLHPIHLPIHIRADLARRTVGNRSNETSPQKTKNAPSGLSIRFRDHMKTAEKKYLEEVVITAGGSVQKASRLSELSRAQVYRLLKKHKISLR